MIFPILGLLIAMVSITIGAALAKGLFPELGAQGTTAARFVVASIIMFIALRGWRASITRDNWASLVIYGLTLCGMNLFFYLAMTTLPLGVTSAIQFTGPLAVSVLFSDSKRDYLWAVLAGIGLLLLTPFADSTESLDTAGIAWALASAVCWALYIVYGRRAGAQHGMQAAALGMMIAAVIALPIGVGVAGTALLETSLLPLILAVALLSSAIPFTLEMFSLQRLPTRTFGVLMSIEPVIAAVTGLLFLQEILTSKQSLAIVLVVAACSGAALSARPRPTEPPQI